MPSKRACQFLVLQPPVHIIVEMPKRDRCKQCNGVAFVLFQASDDGASMSTGSLGTQHRHIDTCPTNFCPHGERYNSETDCQRCEAERAESET